MRGSRILMLAAAVGLWPVPAGVAGADNPQVNDRPLSEFVATRDYLEDLERYLHGYEAWIGPCPTAHIAGRVRTMVLQKTVPFPEVPVPSEAQWVEIVRITGCTRPYERPVYVTVDQGKTIFYAHLLGTTRTEPQLQHRAVNSLIAAEKAAAIASGCPQTQPVRVITTAYVSEFSTEYGKGWRETWTLANCRGLKQVPIEFKPDHTGGIAIRFED